MKKFFIFISIFILTIFVGENKDLINFKLAFLNKEFKYIRYDDWLNYNNTKLNLKNLNNNKLLINIESKNLNYIKNEFEGIKFELEPSGNIKFYFVCNKNYIQKIIKNNLTNKDKEINYFIGHDQNNNKKLKLISSWSTHNNSNFTDNKDNIIINSDNPGYGSHIWNSFQHDEENILVLNFKGKIEKTQVPNKFFVWIGDHYGDQDRKRIKIHLEDEFNDYFLFHNNKFKYKDKIRYLGFDNIPNAENKIYIKDLELIKFNLKDSMNYIKLSENFIFKNKLNILVIEFKNLGKNKKTFKLGNYI